MPRFASIPLTLAVVFSLCEAQDLAAVRPGGLPMLAALQTHMPTKQGNVPHLEPQEAAAPAAQMKIRLDPEQLRREVGELLQLSQSLQGDIEAISNGLYPKDTAEKLKRIQKVAKHMKGEIAP